MTEQVTATPTIIRRTFNAPMTAVFNAWTNARLLCQWQRPNTDVECEFIYADIRTGGSALHKMVMKNGFEMWLLTRYVEIEAPHRLVFIQYESNTEGDVLPPSMPDWPAEIVATVEFEETAQGTEMEFRWQPHNLTAQQAAVWEAAKGQAVGGWSSSFEQLERTLSDA